MPVVEGAGHPIHCPFLRWHTHTKKEQFPLSVAGCPRAGRRGGLPWDPRPSLEAGTFSIAVRLHFGLKIAARTQHLRIDFFVREAKRRKGWAAQRARTDTGTFSPPSPLFVCAPLAGFCKEQTLWV